MKIRDEIPYSTMIIVLLTLHNKTMKGKKSTHLLTYVVFIPFFPPQSKNRPHLRGEYNVYSTFQSHEPEFDYLKSLEIEEKINKIRWLPQQNAAHFLLSTNGKSFPIFLICR